MGLDEDRWSQDCYDRLMAHRPGQLAIDSETTGLAWTDTAFGVSFAWYENKKGGEGVIPVLYSGYIDIRYASELWNNVKAWIKEDKPELIFHNAKFDMHKLGLYPQADNFHDTCLMVYLLNEHHPKKLKILAKKVLKEETDESTAVRNARQAIAKASKKDGVSRKLADIGYDELPLPVIAPYAIKDAEFTLRLYARLAVALAKEPELETVYSLERQLLLCVAGTELRGMSIDIDYAKKMVIQLGDEIIQVEREISDIVGKPVGKGEAFKVRDGNYKNGNPRYRTEKPNEFNPNSPDQILEYFSTVGVNASGTKDIVLQALSHPLADALLRLRPLLKDRNTYFVPMVKESQWSEKLQCWVLHPNFNLTETKTFRSSSSKVKD